MIDQLLLWDIDGTLVQAGELGAVVFEDALEAVYRWRPTARVRMSGKTDPQIVDEYLEMMEWDPAHVDAVLVELAARLAAVEGRLAREGSALPGARELLTRLARTEGVKSSILTGNIAPNARVKLRAFGLDHLVDFEVGAYGGDNRDRTALVPVALGRLAAREGVVLDPEQVWVVGDTPRDLACARAVGAHCLLVATGRFGFEELEALQPDAVVRGLADTDAVFTILTADRPVAPGGPR